MTSPKGKLHKATYATDKKNPGQYLIRVQGPTAAVFAGREVPVERKDGEVHTETLGRCIWAGIDNESQQPVALYKFESKPREDEDEEMPF